MAFTIPERRELTENIRYVRAASFVSPTCEGPNITAPNITTTVSFSFPVWRGPAFRSAVEEFSNRLGTAVAAPHAWNTEHSLTDAIIVTALLRAAVNAVVPMDDPFFSL